MKDLELKFFTKESAERAYALRVKSDKCSDVEISEVSEGWIVSFNLAPKN